MDLKSQLTGFSCMLVPLNRGGREFLHARGPTRTESLGDLRHEYEEFGK